VLPAQLRQDHTALGGAIFSVMGTTYAVLLAFMATTAWDQYTAAQALARHEANVLGGLYRGSYGLAEPAGGTVRHDLLAYLRHVIDEEWPDQMGGRTIAARDPLLADLGRVILGAAPATNAESNAQSFLIGALGEADTARRDRRLAAHGDIPNIIWCVLLAGGALLIGFSFVLGGPKPALHLLMTATLVASGVLVLLLIVGLSSPFHGAVTIPSDAYQMVLDELTRA
jgi:hypothetical protein